MKTEGVTSMELSLLRAIELMLVTIVFLFVSARVTPLPLRYFGERVVFVTIFLSKCICLDFHEENGPF